MEQKNCLAIAVSEDEKLWGGHFGMAPFYWIYTPEGELLEKRRNPFGAHRGEKHEHHDDPRRIVKLLSDCRVFIGKRMGEESRRKLAEKMGIQPVLIKEETPQAALRIYLQNDD